MSKNDKPKKPRRYLPWPIYIMASTTLYILIVYYMNEWNAHAFKFLFKLIFQLKEPLCAFIAFWALPSYWNQRKKRKRVDFYQTLDEIKKLDWKEFEELVAEAYRRKNYSVHENGVIGADGGVDIFMVKNKIKYIVQCKHWQASTVGVPVVREMFGVMHDKKADHVIVVTSGRFTNEAIDFAEHNPITLVSGTALVELINEVSRKPKKINASDICPECGGKLVIRNNRSDGSQFLGCENYPACSHTKSV